MAIQLLNSKYKSLQNLGSASLHCIRDRCISFNESGLWVLILSKSSGNINRKEISYDIMSLSVMFMYNPCGPCIFYTIIDEKRDPFKPFLIKWCFSAILLSCCSEASLSGCWSCIYSAFPCKHLLCFKNTSQSQFLLWLPRCFCQYSPRQPTPTNCLQIMVV